MLSSFVCGSLRTWKLFESATAGAISGAKPDSNYGGLLGRVT